MKIGYALFCSALAFSFDVSAAELEGTKYRCVAGGCEVHCKTENGQWTLYEKAMTSVKTVNHANGNVALFIDDGARGKRTLLISPINLLCRVSNYTSYE